jgi:hypothetical protein
MLSNTGAPKAFSNLGSIIDALSNSINANAGIMLTEITSIANRHVPLTTTIFWTFFSYKSLSALKISILALNNFKFLEFDSIVVPSFRIK